MESEIERLRKKVENFPSASSYNRLAELSRLAGDDGEAERVCRKCIKEFPRNGQAYVILAEIRLAQNKKPDAVQLLQIGIERDPRSYTAHRLMADLLVADGAKDQALAHLRQILTFKPSDPAVSARIVELEGKPGKAADTAPTVVGGTPAVRRSIPTPRPGTVTTTTSQPAASAQPAAAPTRTMPATRVSALDALCAEAGVNGALVADASGRTVVARKLPAAQEELLAALASEIVRNAAAALGTVGQDRLSTLTVVGAQGQMMAFSRDQRLTVIVLATAQVRPAMLELRARQVLIDLGAG